MRLEVIGVFRGSGQSEELPPCGPIRDFVQWAFLGTLVGRHPPLEAPTRTFPSENDSDQGPRRILVPKTSFSILRVIWVIVGLFLLLSLLSWAGCYLLLIADVPVTVVQLAFLKRRGSFSQRAKTIECEGAG
jgi:hypothetical protein